MKQNRRVEDYMKVIYHLREKGLVRGVDIARELDVKKPTVSVVLKKMEARGLVAYQPDRGIDLTAEGEKIAHEVIGRYEALYGFLTDLGIDKQAAREDACRMEHGISDTSISALIKLRQYLQAASYTPDNQSSKSKDDFL